jgi:methylglutaconyl-CoA hydratase
VKHLEISERDRVMTVAMNRPERRNAFHPEMIDELTKIFLKVRKMPDVRAVVLTGKGESFCSGGDLEWMKSMASYTKTENLRDAERLFKMFQSIRECPLPVIGRVFGHAFGGGAGLLAVCDIVIADAETQICFSEVKWGLVPAVISPFVVDRASASAIRYWFLTACVFKAEEARAGGLVHFAGSPSACDKYLEQTIDLLRAAGPEAVRLTKTLHQSFSPVKWSVVKAKVTRLIAERRVSAEGQAGLGAFLQRKTPVWP